MIAKLILWSLPFWPAWAQREFLREVAKREFGAQWRLELIKRGLAL